VARDPPWKQAAPDFSPSGKRRANPLRGNFPASGEIVKNLSAA
jgi:hypothetical protein